MHYFQDALWLKFWMAWLCFKTLEFVPVAVCLRTLRTSQNSKNPKYMQGILTPDIYIKSDNKLIRQKP